MTIFIFFLGTLVFAYFSWRYAVAGRRRRRATGPPRVAAIARQTLSASVEAARATPLAAPHVQFLISGMSSP